MAEPELRKGSTDPAVRDLQEALKALGYDPGPIDGNFRNDDLGRCQSVSVRKRHYSGRDRQQTDVDQH
jgi:Putative peptidoglycan binding domain